MSRCAPVARYELKYLVDEAQIAHIRACAQAYCAPDPHGDAGRYHVNSLYLDTPDWMTAEQTLQGLRNRFKIRLRTYAFTEHAPVFCEEKRRVGSSILKTRVCTDPQLVRAWLADPLDPRLQEAVLDDPDLALIVGQVQAHDLRPRLWVRYHREAYGSCFGDGARLTLDRTLEVQPPDPLGRFAPDPGAWEWVSAAGARAVLELKFNGGFPAWMRALVHGLGLQRVSFGKYVEGGLHRGAVADNRLREGIGWMAS